MCLVFLVCPDPTELFPGWWPRLYRDTRALPGPVCIKWTPVVSCPGCRCKMWGWDQDAVLSLVESDHVPWMLASDWSRVIRMLLRARPN